MNNENKSLKKTIEKLILSSNKVFIVGHNEPDFDAIGSAIGLQVLATSLLRKAYIVVDDVELEPGVKKIVDEYRNRYNIINKKQYEELRTDNMLLIMTDVNKDYMISLGDRLADFKKVLIIDHHKEDEHTVDTKYKFIDLKTSSACETVTKLLTTYKQPLININTANFLLSGIILDTKRFRKATSTETLQAAKHLIKKGATIDYVEDLFLREFEEDKKINNLVFGNTVFRTFTSGLVQNKNIAFTLNREAPDTIYKREDLAKAADKVMRYKVDAAFAIGYVKDNLLSVSARSKSDIDVSDILTSIEGIQSGGNPNSAGAKVEGMDIYDLEKLIVEKATEYLENTHDDPFVLKKTRKL